MGVIFGLIGLSIIVFIHELGHMLAAKAMGIGVPEFSVGMGPKLASFQYKNTRYFLRLLPLGGFVKLSGLEDPEADIPPQENYRQKPVYARLITILAGPLSNIVLGFLLLTTLFAIVGAPTQLSNAIDKVITGSPAQSAGLRVGDKILAVNGHAVTDPMSDIITTVHRSAGKPVTLTIKRENHLFQAGPIQPRLLGNSKTTYAIGIQLAAPHVPYSLPQAVRAGAIETWRQMGMFFKSIRMLITREASVGDLMGPVGIIQLTSSQAQKGLVPMLGIMAVISISLGVINLVPLPVLDGGHILLLGVEAVRGKPLSTKWETRIMNTGVALLVTLMVMVVLNDIINWKVRMGIFS